MNHDQDLGAGPAAVAEQAYRRGCHQALAEAFDQLHLWDAFDWLHAQRSSSGKRARRRPRGTNGQAMGGPSAN